jgi:hypothetical protein
MICERGRLGRDGGPGLTAIGCVPSLRQGLSTVAIHAAFRELLVVQSYGMEHAKNLGRGAAGIVLEPDMGK